MANGIRSARTRAGLLAGVALAIAAGSALVVWRLAADYERQLEEARGGAGDVSVVVATRELLPGARISPEDVTIARRARDEVGRSSISETSMAINQVVGDRILPGEAIRFERLLAGGAQLGVGELLDPGARAITVRTDRYAAVGGLLQPGAYVDVIVTIRPDTQALSADWVTDTILQGVRVLAVGDINGRNMVLGAKQEDDGSGSARAGHRDLMVTLEMEPAEAEGLALASARGELHLSLRGAGDLEMLEPGKPLVTNALMGLPVGVQKAQERRLTRKREVGSSVSFTTEVIRAGEVSLEKFDDAGQRVQSATDTKKKR